MTQTATAPTKLPAPSPERFPLHAAAWFLFCTTHELNAGPVAREPFGKPLVAWRSKSGDISIMDARCSHLGADLSRGTVHDDCLRCPFHHWEYGVDGRCAHIPAH